MANQSHDLEAYDILNSWTTGLCTGMDLFGEKLDVQLCTVFVWIWQNIYTAPSQLRKKGIRINVRLECAVRQM